MFTKILKPALTLTILFGALFSFAVAADGGESNVGNAGAANAYNRTVAVSSPIAPPQFEGQKRQGIKFSMPQKLFAGAGIIAAFAVLTIVLTNRDVKNGLTN